MLQIPSVGSCGLQRPKTARAPAAEPRRAARAPARDASSSSSFKLRRQRGQLQIAASLTKRADELRTSGGALRHARWFASNSSARSPNDPAAVAACCT
jgi:hypothetical protein